MVKILVVSDLHAFTPRDNSAKMPSFFVNSSAPGRKQVNPIEKIASVIDKEQLDVDWILCPGDIADQADPEAQAFAWKELFNLKRAVGAKLLLCAAGNHDVDSRFASSDFDPKGLLQSLTPPFPGLNDTVADHYWARNFCIHTEKDIRVVNLNSAAFHGFQSKVAASKPEYLHGRVSNKTIEAIESELAKRKCKYNILLTHHHPFKNDEIYEEDYSEMMLGGKLIQRISEATESSWLIVHGHQHYPQLKYGAGTTFQPVIFSAGSASAALESPLSAEAPNQFYHISLELDDAKTRGWWPCGVVRAWHWAKRREWQRSPMECNIPYGIGFGCRDNIPRLVCEISQEMGRDRARVFQMDEIFVALPHLQFMIGPTFEAVARALEREGIRCTKANPVSESTLRWINP